MLTVDEGEVHVWLEATPEMSSPEGSIALLDEDERVRAASFRADRDRVRFVGHHAFTRRVLGRYVHLPPAAVAIRRGPHGKPEVDSQFGVSFNMSRSNGLSAVVVGRGQVGVDVEGLRQVDDALDLADALFCEAERRHLRRLPSTGRSRSFLALWTRKESVVKAFGSGLSQRLDTFDVSDTVRDGSGQWHGRLGTMPYVLAQLDTPRGWVGSVCIMGASLSVRSMDSTRLSR